jgi:hypothetical protein
VAAAVAASVAIGVVTALLWPQSDPMERRLAAVLTIMVAAVAVVAVTRGWHRTALQGPSTWRRTALLLVPAIVALAPRATGFDLPATRALAVLVVGYAATGVFEEVWHRGVVLDVLRQKGLRRSALIGGVLFGLSHLANVAFGQGLFVSLAQAVGATLFGIGYGILRWRTAAVWLLVPIHAIGDLLLHITNLTGGALWAVMVAHDAIVLLWGLWCLRGANDDVTAA